MTGSFSPAVFRYVVSKHAVRAFSEAVRGKVKGIPDVDITTIVPQSVDTPILANAANFRGARVRPIPPMLSPDWVTAGIERYGEQPKREVTYGRAGRALEVMRTLAPPLYRRLAHPAGVAGTLVVRPRQRARPARRAAVEGSWRRSRRGQLKRAFLEAGTTAILGRRAS